MDGGYDQIAPVAQHAAARGFPVVMVDAMGYLPFAENTLDVVHASWVYHTGIPTSTIYEMYRVLRPGGYLILRQSIGFEKVKNQLKHIAFKEGWRLHMPSFICATHGGIIAYQMPIF